MPPDEDRGHDRYPRSLFGRRRLGFGLMALVADSASAQDRRDDRKSRISFEFEKDVAVDKSGKIGVGAFKWSPDSRHIAYNKWNAGQVGIVDVVTGQETTIPDFEMPAIQGFAWSDDGQLLAMSSLIELRIVRLSDFKTISSVYFLDLDSQSHPERLGHYRTLTNPDRLTGGGIGLRFSPNMAFSPDGSKLLFETGRGDILVAAYDLATEAIEPLVHSPLPDRNAGPFKQDRPFPGGGRFHSHDNRLLLSTWMQRYADSRRASNVRVDLAHGVPSTCLVVDMGKPTDFRSLDFPPFGTEQITDGKGEIFGYAYSATTDSLVVMRYAAWNEPASQPEKIFFETYRLSHLDGRIPWVQFPDINAPEAGFFYDQYNPFVLHPTQPWMVVMASSRQSPETWMIVWDYLSGQLIARTKIEVALYHVAISPDGARAAFHPKIGNRLRVFKFADR